MPLLILLLLAFTPPALASTNFTDLLSRDHPKADYRVAYGEGSDQFGELWLPTDVKNPPVVIMIHGGCWLTSLPGVELMGLIADDLRRAGVAVWNIEYRRLGP